MFYNNRASARDMDRMDELSSFRNKFVLPRSQGQLQTYFLGNSLGLQPKSTGGAIEEILTQWGQLGVEGFFEGNNPWIQLHRKLADQLSKLVGAEPDEISVMHQLSVNIELLLVSFYRPFAKRKKILIESKPFPSDLYIIDSHLRMLGINPEEVLLKIGPRPGETCIRTEDLLQLIETNKSELSLVFLGGVNYYTGQLLDMEKITSAAKDAGAMVGFDLAHAVGNVELALHRWNVDFACWCSYKYLNGGPGTVGGAYIHSRYHRNPMLHRIEGWWGNRKSTRFLMNDEFDPTPSAEAWQLSTPSPLLFACLKSSLDIFMEAGWDKILHKSRKLSSYLFFVLEEALQQSGGKAFSILTPKESDQRGAQVSLLFETGGEELFRELKKEGFMVDWREPNVIRLAPVPLYNSFEEVFGFGEILRKLL
jgi:kynureninase